MNKENLKELIKRVEKSKDFDWSRPSRCLGSLVGNFMGLSATLKDFLDLSQEDAEILYYCSYPDETPLIDMRGKSLLAQKRACLKFLREGLERGYLIP